MGQNGDVKQVMYHTEGAQKLDATIQNLVDQETWCPRICTPGLIFYLTLDLHSVGMQ
jgi:hypothetical protein